MTQKRDFWAAHVEAWRSSGQTQSGYCREHQLSLASFGYWRRQLGGATGRAHSGMIPIVPAVSATPLGSPRLEVALANGLTLRVPMAAEPARLVAWVQALGSC